jgi:cell wall-associated NlpC family hydrolase
MSGRGDSIAARAKALVGTRFRPQGRDPRFGLDCVGTAAAAAGVAAGRVRRDYPLSGPGLAEVEHGLCDLGCFPVPVEEQQPGDVVLCSPGAGQIHLLVATESGFVHADAGLRMVVERPGPAPWPVLGVWRMNGGE